MRVLLRILLATIVGGVLTAVVVFRDDLSRVISFLPEAAAVTLAAVLGFLLSFGRQRSPRAAEGVLPLTSVVDATPPPTPSADHHEQRMMLTFARHLVDGTAHGDVRALVEAHLPPMVNGRKVWIATESRHQNALHPQDAAQVERSIVLTEEVQEWTTFALRIDEQRLGLLGVESPGGLPREFRQRIQAVVPLIAHALRGAREVETFREASVVDLLTGAATRREGLSRLQAEVKRAQRTGSSMAVLMIDLDHFKSINDRFGHAAGDELLTAIGQTMQRTLRASDVRCRWGGEEFLIVLPDTTLAQAQVVATHLLHNVAATAVVSPRGPVSSTASIGLTIARPAETDVNRIVSRADMGLYQAKHAGRSCIRIVLGGFDGEPVGMEAPRKASPQAVETLPFPDRRKQHGGDRRKVPGPGRRRTDAETDEEASRRTDESPLAARR